LPFIEADKANIELLVELFK